jgi:hypothetical protein
MDLMLVGVTSFSLLLAVGLSLVAWKLLRDGRERSAARVEALEALAFGVDADEPVLTLAGHGANESIAPPVTRARPVVDVRNETDGGPEGPPLRQPQFGDETADEQWDLALRETRAVRDEALPAPRERPVVPHRHAAVHDVMFDAPAQSTGRARLWLALAAVALLMIAGVVSLRALNSPEIASALAAAGNTSRAARPSETPPLQLLSLRHGVNADGAFSVTGLVQNPAEGRTERGLIAVVYVFDAKGEYFASGRATVDLDTFQPGDESPFVVTIPATSGVSRYRVGFRYQDGGVVSHVDRRGPPGDTAGGTIDLVEPAPLDRVKRSEG